MPNIKIDQETYHYLQKKAIAFVETPGDTVKRLLGLVAYKVDEFSETEYVAEPDEVYPPGKDRQKKVSLFELIRAGMLKQGQKLIFQDYSGNQHLDYDVALSNGKLLWRNQTFSMSQLAQKFLKQKGHKATSVRGPIFWATTEGRTIAELWENYLKEKDN